MMKQFLLIFFILFLTLNKVQPQKSQESSYDNSSGKKLSISEIQNNLSPLIKNINEDSLSPSQIQTNDDSFNSTTINPLKLNSNINLSTSDNHKIIDNGEILINSLKVNDSVLTLYFTAQTNINISSPEIIQDSNSNFTLNYTGELSQGGEINSSPKDLSLTFICYNEGISFNTVSFLISNEKFTLKLEKECSLGILSDLKQILRYAYIVMFILLGCVTTLTIFYFMRGGSSDDFFNIIFCLFKEKEKENKESKESQTHESDEFIYLSKYVQKPKGMMFTDETMKSIKSKRIKFNYETYGTV